MGLLTLKSGPFHRIGSRYGHFFDADHFLGRSAFEDLWISKAPANIRKTAKEYILEVALPGFKKEEVNLKLAGDKLIVSAKRNAKMPEYLKMEMSDNFEQRSFDLPANLNQEAIKAKLRDGLLKVIIPFMHNGIKSPHTTISVA